MIFQIKNPDGTTSTINARNRNAVRNQNSFGGSGNWQTVDGVEFGNGVGYNSGSIVQFDPDEYDDNYIELPLLSENQYYDRDTPSENRNWQSVGHYEIKGAGHIDIAFFTFIDTSGGTPVTKYWCNVNNIYNSKYNYTIMGSRKPNNNTSNVLSGARRPRISFDIITIKRSGFTPRPDDPETDCLLVSIWTQDGDNIRVAAQAFFSLSFLTGNSPVVGDNGIYAATPNGGFGNRIRPNDRTGFPDLTSARQASVIQPNLNASGIHIYMLDVAQYGDLFAELWSTKLGNIFKNNKFNPLQGVAAIHKMCCPLDDISGQSVNIRLAGCTLSTQGRPCLEQILFEEFPIVDIPRASNSYLDYEPYTAISLHLPFIGDVPIPANLVMGGKLQVMYAYDRLQGNCTATVKYWDRFGNEDVIGSFSGNCAYQSIISGSDNGFPAIRGAVNNVIGAVGQGLTGVYMNPEPMAIEPMGLDTLDWYKYRMNKHDVSVEHGVGAGLTATVQGLWSAGTAPRTTKTAGSLGSNAGALGNTELYVTITYPLDISTMDEFGNQMLDLVGVHSNTGGIIADYSGHLVAGIVHASTNPNVRTATDAEKSEIESIIAQGVYV